MTQREQVDSKHEQPFIVANRNGWEPSRGQVNSILSKMRCIGLRTDWKYCIGLRTKALMFTNLSTQTAGYSDPERLDTCLIFYLGKFLTEREYLET
jgi:hypothetical protein